MRYYFLVFLIIPLFIGWLELRVIVKSNKSARKKRRNEKRIKHFEETVPNEKTRRIEVRGCKCQNLTELITVSFGLEDTFQLVIKKKREAFLFDLPLEISYPEFCAGIQFMTDLGDGERCYVTGWYSIGSVEMDEEVAPFSNSTVMLTIPDWDEELDVYLVSPESICYRHDRTRWDSLYTFSDTSISYRPIPEL